EGPEGDAPTSSAKVALSGLLFGFVDACLNPDRPYRSSGRAATDRGRLAAPFRALTELPEPSTTMRGTRTSFSLVRLIRTFYRVTAGLLVVGGSLVLLAILTIPVLGYVAAELSAFGIWALLLGAFSACLLLASAVVHRLHVGRWYFG